GGDEDHGGDQHVNPGRRDQEHDDQRDENDAKQRERYREIHRSASPVRDTARAPCVVPYTGPGGEGARTTPEPGTITPRSTTGTRRVTSRRKHASTSPA